MNKAVVPEVAVRSSNSMSPRSMAYANPQKWNERMLEERVVGGTLDHINYFSR